MKTAAALLRVSTNKQELESQINDIRARALIMGYEVPDDLVFGQKITGFEDKYITEIDVEGNRSLVLKPDRESIFELKGACGNIYQGKKIEAIFIWELSRLSRKQSILLDYIDQFTQLKKPIYFISENCWTLNPHTLTEDEAGMMQISFLSRYGQQERVKMLERYKRGKRFAATENRYVGGIIPYGYDVEVIGKKKYYIIHPLNSKVIIDIFEKYLQGWSCDKISRYLNMNQVPTYYNLNNPDKELHLNNGNITSRKNVKWGHSRITKILTNEFYKGERKFSGNTVNSPIIISPDIYDKVQQRMKNNLHFGAKVRKYNYPLKKVLRCGECGEKMRGIVTAGRQVYFCDGLKCGATSINKYNLDGVIWDVAKSNISLFTDYFKKDETKDKKEYLNLMRLNRLESKKIVDLEGRKSSLLGMFNEGLFNEMELKTKALEIADQITKIQESIKEREVEIQVLRSKSSGALTPTELRDLIKEAGKDVIKIKDVVEKITTKIVVTNIINNRFSLVEIYFKNLHPYSIKVVYDYSNKSSEYYRIWGLNNFQFNKENRTFKALLNPVERANLISISPPFKSLKNDKEIRVEELIEVGVAAPNTYKLVEENPFKKGGELWEKVRVKNATYKTNRKAKQPAKEISEEVKLLRQIRALHTKRSKIKLSTLNPEKKALFLIETKVELINLRKKYNEIRG